MKTITTWMVAVTVACLIAPAAAVAQDENYSDILRRVESLEAERAYLQSQFASYTRGDEDGCAGCTGTDCGCQKCASACQDLCCCKTVCPAWVLSYEIAALRPFTSDVVLGPGFDNEYGVGHRFVFGRDGGAGLGVRTRFFMFNHGHGFQPPAANTLNIDLDVLDFEVTLNEQFCHFDLLLSGGLRYARQAYNLGPDALYIEGVGATVSVEATREIGCRGFYLVGNFRPSLIFSDISSAPGFGLPVDVNDDLLTMFENQLGIGWSYEGPYGELNLRLVGESQFWMNDLFADVAGIGTNLGLGGVSILTELRW